jgi:hypothetical protein
VGLAGARPGSCLGCADDCAANTGCPPSLLIPDVDAFLDGLKAMTNPNNWGFRPASPYSVPRTPDPFVDEPMIEE